MLRSGLSWTTSVAESDFDLFYDRFYVPFVTQRHPDSGASGGEEKLRKLFRRGFLLWIHQGEEKLAGAILNPDGEVKRWFVVGARTDGVDPVKSGALSHKRSWGAMLKDSPRVDHDTLFRWDKLAALPLDARADLVTARDGAARAACTGGERLVTGGEDPVHIHRLKGPRIIRLSFSRAGSSRSV